MYTHFVAPTINFELSSYIFEESDGSVECTLLLSNPSVTDILIHVLTTDGSATGKVISNFTISTVQIYYRIYR